MRGLGFVLLDEADERVRALGVDGNDAVAALRRKQPRELLGVGNDGVGGRVGKSCRGRAVEAADAGAVFQREREGNQAVQ